MSKTVASLLVVFTLWTASNARAQTTDQAFRTDIARLLEITGAAAMSARMATLVSDQMLNQLRQSQPDFSERAASIVKDTLNDEFTKAFAPGPEGMQEQLIDMYARHLSHDDVRAIIAFYSSDIGRRLLAKQPLFLQEGAAIGQQWSQSNMPRIAQVIRQRLQAEGLVR